MDKTRKSNLMYSLLALLFSILLFFNVNSKNVLSSIYSSNEEYDEKVDGIVIHPLYDSDEYYIHGFDSTVSVQLSSPNRIQLNMESNPDTRNFKIVADLTNLEEGTHEVRLRATNLSSAVSAKIEPSTITVTIEKKVTKTFTVEPVVTASSLDEGFKLNTYSASPKTVEITTGDKTMKDIERVVATVDPTTSHSENFTEEVAIQALNNQDEPLSIQSNPEKVKVSVKIIAPEKEVNVYAVQQGETPAGISHFEFHIEDSAVTIKGAQSVLDTVENIAVPVDVSNIHSETTRTIVIPTADGYTVTPKSVDIQVVPVYSTENTDTTTEGSSYENYTGNQTTPSSSESSDSSIENSSSSSDITSSSDKTEDDQAAEDSSQ